MSAGSSLWVRAIASRAALIAGGLLFSLLMIEIVLQVGALFTSAAAGVPQLGWMTGRRRLLCLGDSNTYGLYVGPAAAYPRVLARLAPDQVEVLNLGFPGYNSSKVRHALPRLLRELEPDVVTLMIGGNDFWTLPEPDEAEQGTLARLGDLAWRYSRSFRLLYMVRRTFDRADVVISPVDGRLVAGNGERAIDMGVEPVAGHPTDAANRMRANLIESIGTIRAAGATPLLLTYPADRNAYGVANRIMRETAASTGVGLVDISRRFASRCPGWKCPDLLFFDDHPVDEGHRIAADELLKRLIEIGVISAASASPQAFATPRGAEGPAVD